MCTHAGCDVYRCRQQREAVRCSSVELCVHTQGAMYIGADNNVKQCVAAVDNVEFARETHAVHIVQADVTCTC